jgi:hypothetical protein
MGEGLRGWNERTAEEREIDRKEQRMGLRMEKTWGRMQT